MPEDAMDGRARDDLDRSLAEAMRELSSLAQVRLPGSSQARVDHEVAAAIVRIGRERKEQTMNQAALATPTVDRARPRSSATSGRAQHHSPAWTWLTTAALLVVALGLSIAAFGPVRLQTLNPIIHLAAFVQQGTPTATGDTRFAVTFPAPVLPAGPVYAWSTLYEVDPAVSTAYPGFKIDSPVAALVWVQSGTMAIDGEHVALHRASAGIPSASPAPGELLLGAGDALGVELGPGRSYHLRSVGPEPLVFAEFWLIGGPRPRYPWPSGYHILDFSNHENAASLTSPATVTMELTQAVLSGEETLAPPEGAWQLALAKRPTDTLISRHGPSNALENLGQTPVTVVAMTAAFQETAGTSPAASPTG